MYDLNIKYKPSKEKERKKVLLRAKLLGMKYVAWNIINVGKVGKSTGGITIPLPVEMDQINDISSLKTILLSNGRQCNTDITQYTRITLIIDEIADAQTIVNSNEILSKFDIVAVSPGNVTIFNYLCKTADVDIITLDFTHKLPFALNKKLIDEAVSRGIYFEIQYTPFISSSSQIRREILNSTRILIQYLNQRHIIFTSGTESASYLRSPLDICSIVESLKINKQNAIKTISENAAAVIQHGRLRKNQNMNIEIISSEILLNRFPNIQLPLLQNVYNENQLNKIKDKYQLVKNLTSMTGNDYDDDVDDDNCDDKDITSFNNNNSSTNNNNNNNKNKSNNKNNNSNNDKNNDDKNKNKKKVEINNNRDNNIIDDFLQLHDDENDETSIYNNNEEYNNMNNMNNMNDINDMIILPTTDEDNNNSNNNQHIIPSSYDNSQLIHDEDNNNDENDNDSEQDDNDDMMLLLPKDTTTTTTTTTIIRNQSDYNDTQEDESMSEEGEGEGDEEIIEIIPIMNTQKKYKIHKDILKNNNNDNNKALTITPTNASNTTTKSNDNNIKNKNRISHLNNNSAITTTTMNQSKMNTKNKLKLNSKSITSIHNKLIGKFQSPSKRK